MLEQSAQQALTGQAPEQAIAGIDASVTSDKDGSNALAPIFNREEIEAGFQIVGALTREVGTFLENRVKEQTQAQKALKEEQAKAPAQQDSQRIAQLQQTLQENQTWEMGGTGRLLMTALTLAAGSNISGTTGQLLQATAVNTLQGLGAQQIKLLADSLDSEAARTALQGLLAGAGAAAQGQNATPAALGASASVVLNNLIESAYGESSRQLTAEEREARKNLITTLITGTTQALGGDAALANAAATIETENNSMGGMMSAGIDIAIAMDPKISLKEKADLYKGMAANELEMSALLGGFPCLVTRNLLYDLQALRQGETTLADIAQQRGVEYVTGTLVTAMTMTGLNLVYQQGKLVIAPIAKNIQQSAAIQSSRQVVHTALSKMGINPATQGASKAVATASGQLSKEAAQVTVQTSGINVKIPPGNPLSNAGQVAAKPPGVGSNSVASKKLLIVDTDNAHNHATFELYKSSLRAKMEKPIVKDKQLKGLLDDLYRPKSSIGVGSTSDAVRYEITTGNTVGGCNHIQKSQDYSKALRNWLEKNPTASLTDRAAAENVLLDLQNALQVKQ